MLIVLSEIFNVKELIPVGGKLRIPDPWHVLISLSNIVKSRAVKSWFIAIPFDALPTSVIVLLLIVIFAVEVAEEAMTAIPLSLGPVIVLFVTNSIKVSTGVARVSPEPPLSDIVFVEAVRSRVVKAPEVYK